MAPTNAHTLTSPNWKTVTPTGSRMASAAPSAAPDDVPRTYGSASGLRTIPWNVAPATARPAPTSAAVRTRGSRSSQTIVSVAAGHWPPRSSPNARFRMTPSVSVGPIAIDPTVTAATSATTSSATPMSATVAGRLLNRPETPVGRSSAGIERAVIGSGQLAGGSVRAGYIAGASFRMPVASRGPGRVISVSETDRTSPFFTAVSFDQPGRFAIVSAVGA